MQLQVVARSKAATNRILQQVFNKKQVKVKSMHWWTFTGVCKESIGNIGTIGFQPSTMASMMEMLRSKVTLASIYGMALHAIKNYKSLAWICSKIT